MPPTAELALPAAPERLRRPVRVGPLRLATPFNLAPLAGYTNLPFRLCVREAGPIGLCTTDLLNARAVVEGSAKTRDLMATSDADRPLAMQLFGNRADDMVRAAQVVEDLGVSAVDVNMGCPVRKVVKNGGGSAMMCDAANTVDMVRRIVEAVGIPVTVKMRLGWDDDNLNAPFFAREFENAGVAALTIHGRTREQGFGGRVNVAGIRAVVEAVERIPVFGNGDVRTLHDAHQMLTETGCAGIAIGRGALLNPWFFLQLARWVETGDPGPVPGYEARLDFMSRHVRRLADWRGDRWGCVQFRKVANWYCRALRVEHGVQQQLVMLDSLANFDAIVGRLRDAGPPVGWHSPGAADLGISLPTGPIAHW